MIISTRDDRPVLNEPKYPCLMISNIDLVVLFEKSKVGTVITNGPYHALGYYSESWDMPEFTPYVGTITLRNG